MSACLFDVQTFIEHLHVKALNKSREKSGKRDGDGIINVLIVRNAEWRSNRFGRLLSLKPAKIIVYRT